MVQLWSAAPDASLDPRKKCYHGGTLDTLPPHTSRLVLRRITGLSLDTAVRHMWMSVEHTEDFQARRRERTSTIHTEEG